MDEKFFSLEERMKAHKDDPEATAPRAVPTAAVQSQRGLNIAAGVAGLQLRPVR